MAEPASAHAIEFVDVEKRFGKFAALDGLTVRVRRGEIYGLLGPNGSGKTTAIRVLMGLTKRTSGVVRALGEDAPSRALLPRIGYMPQETALYQDLTVMENLELFGALQGMPRADVHARAAKLLQLVDLSKWENALIHELSGGMKHRTSLVVALLHDPELLVLDEPTVGVDPEIRIGFWDYFASLKKTGRTVLITTHYMDEARKCDRVGLIRSGKLIAEAPVDELLRQNGVDNLEDAFIKLAGRFSATGASA